MFPNPEGLNNPTMIMKPLTQGTKTKLKFVFESHFHLNAVDFLTWSFVGS